MPLLSIVVPIRDMSGKLNPLFSWVNEALSFDCEVVLVHDFLDQRTEDELVHFINKHHDENIRFVSSIFNSPGLARNAGLKETSGEFIVFWDSDDFPQVKEAVNAAKECKITNSDIAIGGFRTVSETGELLREYPSSFQPDLTQVAIYPGLWRMIFRASILSDMKFINLLLAEDQIFLAELKLSEKKKLFIDSLIYSYTLLRKGSLTSLNTNINDLVYAIRILLTKIQNQMSKGEFEFVLTLLIRNSITVIKNGDHKQKIQVLQLIKNEVMKHPIYVARVLIVILNFKLKEQLT